MSVRSVISNQNSPQLPLAHNIGNPNKFKCWSNFTSLEKIRNNIVHLKSRSIRNSEKKNQLIWQLVDESIFKYMNSGKELITTLQRYLGKHPDFPIMKITEDLEITIADTFDDFISDRK